MLTLLRRIARDVTTLTQHPHGPQALELRGRVEHLVDAFRRLRRPLPTGCVYRCEECGSSEVHGTAWVHLNTDNMTNDEPPFDSVFLVRSLPG